MADPNSAYIESARLTRDPELKTTAGGNTLVNFSLASNGYHKDAQTGQYVNDQAVYWNCTAWGQIAHNIAASLHKGDEVTGLLRPRTVEYDSKDGTHNRTIQWTVVTIGPSLSHATAVITRNPPRSQAPAMPHVTAPTMPQATPPAQQDEYDPWANQPTEPEF